MKRKTMLCVLLCAAPAVFAGAPGALAADGETAARADVAAAAVSYAVGSLHSGPSELGVRPVHTVSDDGYLYGCINEEGKLLTPPNSARDVLTQSGLILVHDGPLHENGGSRLVDADGNTVRAFDRSVVQYDGKRGVAVESANDAAGGLRYALTDENGVPLTEFAFEEMYLSANDTGADAILAKKDFLRGMLNPDGSVKLPFEYRGIYRLNNSACFTLEKADGTWGAADFDGNIFIPTKSVKLRPRSTPLTTARRPGP